MPIHGKSRISQTLGLGPYRKDLKLEHLHTSFGTPEQHQKEFKRNVLIVTVVVVAIIAFVAFTSYL